MTEPRRQDRHPNLLRGSATPEQMRGLKRGHTTHGAHVKALTAPAEARERRKLRRGFPNAAKTPAGRALIDAMAGRAAVLGRYLGPDASGKPGRLSDAAATHAGRLLDAQERAIGRLAKLDREAGQVNPGDALAAIMAELDGDQADGEDGEARWR